MFDDLGRRVPAERRMNPITGLYAYEPHCLAKEAGMRAVEAPKGLATIAYKGLDGYPVPFGFGIVGQDVVVTARHVREEAISLQSSGMQILFGKAELTLSNKTKWYPAPPQMFDTERMDDYIVAPQGYEMVTPRDFVAMYFYESGARLGSLRCWSMTDTAKSPAVACYHYRREDDEWILYRTSGSIEDIGLPARGLSRHTACSVPGSSGCPLFTVDKQPLIAGLNLGQRGFVAKGEDKSQFMVDVAISSKQLVKHFADLDLFEGKTVKWKREVPALLVVVPHVGGNDIRSDTSLATEERYIEEYYNKKYQVEDLEVDYRPQTDDELLEKRGIRASHSSGVVELQKTMNRHAINALRKKSPPREATCATVVATPHSSGEEGYIRICDHHRPAERSCPCCAAAPVAPEGPGVCTMCSIAVRLETPGADEGSSEPQLPEGDMRYLRGETVLVAEDGEEILDSSGKPMLKQIATVLGLPNKCIPPPKYPANADIKEIAEERGMSVDSYTMPVGNNADVKSSLRANCNKRLPQATEMHPIALASFLNSQNVTSPESQSLVSIIDKTNNAISSLNLKKSAGYTGLIQSCVTKEDVVRKDSAGLRAAAIARVHALAKACPKKVARMSALQLVQAGLRDPVIPCIKPEPHPDRKVYDVVDGQKVRKKDPRWRSILVQSTVDEVVGRILHKQQNNAGVAHYQNAPLQHVAEGQSTLGASQTDSGIIRLGLVILAAVALLPDNYQILAESSDVSGMDWCVGAVGVAVDTLRRLKASIASDPGLRRREDGSMKLSYFDIALINYGLVTALPMYLVGNALYAQLQRGVTQSGVVSTGQMNCSVRSYADHLYVAVRCVVANYENGLFRYRVPMSHGDDCITIRTGDSNLYPEEYENKSSLSLRDVITGDLASPVSYLSMRFVLGQAHYEFLNEEKVLSSLYHKTITSEMLLGISVACRHTPAMTRWLDELRRNYGHAEGTFAGIFDCCADDP